MVVLLHVGYIVGFKSRVTQGFIKSKSKLDGSEYSEDCHELWGKRVRAN